jgi:hypothetical protein
MQPLDEILTAADDALAAARSDEEAVRVRAMTAFMEAIEQIAHAIEAGASRDDALRWAGQRAEKLLALENAMTDWQLALGHLFYDVGGEEHVERALLWRSQHALAREIFRDTPVDALLESYEDAKVDADLRDEARRIAIDGPNWAPRTHTWWRWPDP